MVWTIVTMILLGLWHGLLALLSGLWALTMGVLMVIIAWTLVWLAWMPFQWAGRKVGAWRFK